MYAVTLFWMTAGCLGLIAGQALFDKNKYSGNGETPHYWRKIAHQELQHALHLNKNTGKAKNVILFLGDGMGIPSLTTSRILKGQLKNKLGEEEHLSWDLFPHVGFSKTYNQDHQTPDSAGTGTAFLTGVKTNMGVIGVDARVKPGDCAAAQGAELYSIGHYSLQKGKNVGVVTTSRVTHATPSSLYAHTPHRWWEGDSVTPQNESRGCKDIATQLVDDNRGLNVIMGGGRQFLLPHDVDDPERGSNSEFGRRDGRNLIEDWKNDKKTRNLKHKYAWNTDQFNNVDPAETDYLLGLFEASGMHGEVDRLNSTVEAAGEPSLAEMTEKAIRILRKNDKGFFLLVEGGNIDHFHHEANAYRALHDTLAMDDAVAKAVELTSEMDTLIVVTADHSHTFAMGGYPSRGNPIFGLTDNNGEVALGDNNMTYTTLVYGNGPGWQHPRHNLTQQMTEDKDYKQNGAVPMGYETHGGEDVGIFARGPWAHLFHGVHQQNYIPHVMMYASCVGEYAKDKDCAASYCKGGATRNLNANNPANAAVRMSINAVCVIVMTLIYYFMM